MSDEQSPQPDSSAEVPEEDGPPSTPFDSPWFIPVLLWPASLWFGYDGWFSETIESVMFNRFGFGFLLGAAIYFSLDAWKQADWQLPALFWGYTAWLGYAGWIAGEDNTFRANDSAWFCEYGSMVTAAFAFLYTARMLWRRRRSTAA